MINRRWQLTPLPRPQFSNIFNQNFEIVILFNVVETSGNYVFEDDNPPIALRERVVSYALEIFGLYRKRDRINFGGGSLYCLSEV